MKTFFAVLALCFGTTLAVAETARILVIGDSLSEGYGVNKEDAYPRQLELLLKDAGKDVTVINAGSSGSTSAGAVARLRWHLKVKPKILILALGANDGLRGVQPDATQKNLAQCITLAKANGVLVYLAGMKMPYNYGEKYRGAFEKIFPELVREFQIKEIPFLLQGVGGIAALNQSDGIHPNEKGHKIIAQNISKVLLKDL